MESQKFNLCWNDYEKCVSNTFRSLLTDQDFTDITLACDDGEGLKAHKVVLSSSSPVLRQLLVKHASPLIYLRGVTMIELKAIIEFIYLGQTEVEQDYLPRFMSVAKDLEIRGLAEDPPTNSTKPDQAFTMPQTEEDNGYQQGNDEANNICEITSYDDNDSGVDPIGNVSEHYMGHMITKMNCESHGDYSMDGIMDIAEDQVESFMGGGVYKQPNKRSRAFIDPNKLTCDKCNFVARTTTYLKLHVESVHEGKRYPCEKCGKTYNFPGDLRRHNKSAHENHRYSCPICGFEATQTQTLKKHIAKHHTDNRNIQHTDDSNIQQHEDDSNIQQHADDSIIIQQQDNDSIIQQEYA